MRRRKLVVLLLLIPLLVCLSALAYLALSDLAWVGSWLTSLASKAMSRPLVVQGSFEADVLSASPRVVATDVSLGDPDGDLSPGMIHVDRLEGDISFSSLYSLPVQIEDLHIQGGLVRLGPAADGSPNWHFGGGATPDGETKNEDFLPVTFGTALLESVTLRYESLRGAAPMVLEIDRLELEPQGNHEHRLNVTGRFRDRPFEVKGAMTRLEELIFIPRPADLDLEAGLADMTATVLGTVGRIWVLAEPELRLELESPDVGQLTEVWRLPSLGNGPFKASARTSTTGEGIRVTVDVDLAELQVGVEGTLDRILKPRRVELDVGTSGLDLAASGALFGLDDLPRGAFDVSGGLRFDQGHVSFQDVVARAAGSRLEIDGELGPYPGFVGTDLEFATSGPELAPFEDLAGTTLPDGSFDASGRLVWQESALEFDGVNLHLGDTVATVRGILGALPDRSQTDLRVEISGPSLAALDLPVPATLPDKPYAASARITSEEDRVGIDAGVLRVGEDSLELAGSFHPSRPRRAARFEVRASGPDLGSTAGLFDLGGLPEQPWEVDGGFTTGASGVTLRATTLRSADVRAAAEGLISLQKDQVGTDLEISGSGSDASRLPPALLGTELPAASWDLSGRLRRSSEGLEIEGVEASLGEVVGQFSGQIALGGVTPSTRLDVKIQTESLDAVEGWYGLPALPDEPFAVSGHLEIGNDRLRLEKIEATMASNRLGLEADLPKDSSLADGDLQFEGSGPNLAGVVSALIEAELVDRDLLEAAGTTVGTAWELDGRILAHPQSYEVRPLKLRIGEGAIDAEGTVGRTPGRLGTDLLLSARGKNAALLAALAGVSARQIPYELKARISRQEGVTTFDGFELEIGDSHASLDGNLGDPPSFAGTSLVVDARVERVGVLADVVGSALEGGMRKLPEALLELPVEISGRVQGSLDDFAIEDLRAVVGKSDISGRFALDRREALELSGHLSSTRIHLPELLGGEPRFKSGSSSGEPTPTKGSEQDRLIPDDPLSLDWLANANGDLRLEIDEIVTPLTRVQELRVGTRLNAGILTLDPVTAKGPLGGTFSGRFQLEQKGQALSLSTNAVATDVRLVQLAPGGDSSQAVSLDLELDLESSGSSLHSLALGSRGRLRSRLGPGLIDLRFVDEILPAFLRGVAEAMNPFRQQDQVAHVECGYFHLILGDGGSKMEPLVLQTTRATILGDGNVRFSDEALDLQWTLKPRKRVGLSSIAATTNPYFKLGGTLAHPEMELKPIEATLSAGAAVATGGLSFVARKLWGRATSGRNVCKKAQKEVAREWQENPQSEAPLDGSSPN